MPLVSLEGKCLWVPASVRHEVKKDDTTGLTRYSFFVYGGVSVQPRINVVQGGNAPLVGNRVGGGEFNSQNRIQHETYKVYLRERMQKPVVQDVRLQKLVNHIYRPNAQVGSGSTAAAIRQENSTGEKVGGKYHNQKGENFKTALNKWIEKNPTASSGDRAAAENILKDLSSAMNNGKKYAI